MAPSTRELLNAMPPAASAFVNDLLFVEFIARHLYHRPELSGLSYAKMRWLYTQLGLGDRTELEFLNGGHTINGEATFRFLRKHQRLG